MAKRAHSFVHNGENYNKRNHFIFTQIVDINGFSLTNYMFIPEYFENLRDFISDEHTQTILDQMAFDNSQIHNMLPDNYFKVTHPEIIKRDFKNMETGKIKDTKHVFWKSLSGALANTEEYHNGIVWFLGNYKRFEALAPYLNRVYLLRLNVDFTELADVVMTDPKGNETGRLKFTDLLDTQGMYDDYTLGKYGLKKIRTIESEKSRKWVEIMAKPVETVREVVSDSMIMITESKEARAEQKDVPQFYDYQFEEYAYTTKFKK